MVDVDIVPSVVGHPPLYPLRELKPNPTQKKPFKRTEQIGGHTHLAAGRLPNHNNNTPHARLKPNSPLRVVFRLLPLPQQTQPFLSSWHLR